MYTKSDFARLIEIEGAPIREAHYQQGLWQECMGPEGPEALALGGFLRYRRLDGGCEDEVPSLRYAHALQISEADQGPMYFSLLPPPAIIQQMLRYYLMKQVRARLEQRLGLGQMGSRLEKVFNRALSHWSYRTVGGMFGNSRIATYTLAARLKTFLDPEVRAWAFRAVGHEAGSKDYSTLYACRSVVEQIEAEAPNLLPLWYALADEGWTRSESEEVLGLQDPSKIVGDLKSMLREKGLSNAGWRYVSRLPYNWVRTFARRSTLDHGPESSMEVLNRLAAIKEPLRYTAFQFVIAENTLGLDQCSLFRPFFGEPKHKDPETYLAFSRALAREGQRRKRGIKALVKNEAALVLDWLRLENVVLDANQRKAGWDFLMRQQQQWHEEVIARNTMHQEFKQWESLVPEFECHKYTVVPLTDSVQLFEEGKLMHHCVGAYGDGCAEGQSRIFSIRLKGIRAVTLELVLDAQRNSWCVAQVRAHCNGAGPKAVKKVAEEVRKQYQAAWVRAGRQHAQPTVVAPVETKAEHKAENKVVRDVANI